VIVKDSSEAAVAGGSNSGKGGASRPPPSSDAPFDAASGDAKFSRNPSIAHMRAAVVANQDIIRAVIYTTLVVAVLAIRFCL
jgi:hypothetical protein